MTSISETNQEVVAAAVIGTKVVGDDCVAGEHARHRCLLNFVGLPIY